LTGDPDFYIKLIYLMRDYPLQHRVEFMKEWGLARDRFLQDFIINFGKPGGGVDWEKLLRYNSGKEQVPWLKVATVVEEDEDEGDDEDVEDNEAEEEPVDE
jgi:hypothetical protein